MIGASDWRIIRSHLLPHLVAPIIVFSTLIIASFILGEAALSFLGLGIKLPTASWGNLLATAPEYYTSVPWLMVWPGLAVAVHDAGVQPARRRPARRVRPALTDVGSQVVPPLRRAGSRPLTNLWITRLSGWAIPCPGSVASTDQTTRGVK